MIPGFEDLLQQLNWLPLEAGALVFFVTGSVLILIRDWRVSIGALTLQYLAMGFTLSRLIRPEIAFAKVLVGLFVSLMLYLSARQSGWRHQTSGLRALFGQRSAAGEAFPPGRAFRLMALLLAAVAAISMSQTYPLANLPAAVSMAIYWLVMIGLLILILSENPLKAGQGLLTLFTGFELFFAVIESSLAMIGLLGIINLLLAMTIGYLSAVRGVAVEEDF